MTFVCEEPKVQLLLQIYTCISSRIVCLFHTSRRVSYSSTGTTVETKPPQRLTDSSGIRDRRHPLLLATPKAQSLELTVRGGRREHTPVADASTTRAAGGDLVIVVELLGWLPWQDIPLSQLATEP